MKKYEPVLENLTITNVDQRNPYAAFTYEESQKKSLINRLVWCIVLYIWLFYLIRKIIVNVYNRKAHEHN